jgi:replicative DNA helicase
MNADPFVFSVQGFRSMPERLDDARQMRKVAADKLVPYGVSFLDEILRGIVPNDLIVIGAYPGAGKSSLANQIAEHSALNGRNVYLFALEAENAEQENRLQHRIAYQVAKDKGYPWRHALNYPDWYLGNVLDDRGERVDLSGLETQVERFIREKLSTLHTYYREQDFTIERLEQMVLTVQDVADVIILDHLHYVDSDDDNQTRAVTRIVKKLRQLAIGTGLPIIVISHLRKKSERKQLVPDLQEFHGSSDISKESTRCIMLGRAQDVEASEPGIAYTYISVPKDRLGGATGLVALLTYDLASGRYASRYQLGRVNFAGDKWERIEPHRLPRWARSAL